MEIRDSEIVKRYKEAKKFVQDYEQQYFLALVSGSCFDTDIWNWRCEIQYRLDRLKELGQLENKQHPYNLQIENRRRYIRDKLKLKYNYR